MAMEIPGEVNPVKFFDIHGDSSVIDKSTGLTNIDIVKDIYEKIKKLL